MIILGIDPGLANTGFGVINKIRGCKNKNLKVKCLDFGVIKTSSSSPSPERLKKINEEVSKLIKNYKPEVLVIENLYFFKNLKTAVPVSQAKGVIMLTAAKNKIPVFEFTPLHVKLTITGFGWAKKEAVQRKVKNILKLKELPKSDDAVDALAAALTYLKTA